MRLRRAIKSVAPTVVILLSLYLAVLVFFYFGQRALLYFPTHNTRPSKLVPWSDGSQTIGYCREVAHPATIWLMMHGNAGQAANRDYVLRCMSDQDSLYVVEYPGYGARPGSPSMNSMNQAAAEAYQLLRARNPTTPVCVLGESIGTGPACVLAGQKVPPDKIVLVVPYDDLANVAGEKFWFLPVRLMLRDCWKNGEALKNYTGPVDIFGATEDTVIPITHPRALARQIPQAKFIALNCGHNDWVMTDEIKIRR
jgi:hypothetical protein